MCLTVVDEDDCCAWSPTNVCLALMLLLLLDYSGVPDVVALSLMVLLAGSSLLVVDVCRSCSLRQCDGGRI